MTAFLGETTPTVLPMTRPETGGLCGKTAHIWFGHYGLNRCPECRPELHHVEYPQPLPWLEGKAA